MTDTRVVELRNLPLLIAHRSNQHMAAILRELALVDAATEAGRAHRRLQEVADSVRGRYAIFSAAPRRRAEEAAAQGSSHVDLRYEVPVDFADDATALAASLREVDDLCRSGEMVTLVAPPDVVAFREWVLREFLAQLRHGAEPTPWTDDSGRPPSSGLHGRPPEATERTATLVLGEDLDLEGAARMRDEITDALERGVTDLVLDASGCAFIDSVGISLLLTTYARLREQGGSLVLTNVDEAVRRTLRHAGIADLLLRE